MYCAKPSTFHYWAREPKEAELDNSNKKQDEMCSLQLQQMHIEQQCVKHKLEMKMNLKEVT